MANDRQHVSDPNPYVYSEQEMNPERFPHLRHNLHKDDSLTGSRLLNPFSRLQRWTAKKEKHAGHLNPATTRQQTGRKARSWSIRQGKKLRTFAGSSKATSGSQQQLSQHFSTLSHQEADPLPSSRLSLPTASQNCQTIVDQPHFSIESEPLVMVQPRKEEPRGKTTIDREREQLYSDGVSVATEVDLPEGPYEDGSAGRGSHSKGKEKAADGTKHPTGRGPVEIDISRLVGPSLRSPEDYENASHRLPGEEPLTILADSTHVPDNSMRSSPQVSEPQNVNSTTERTHSVRSAGPSSDDDNHSLISADENTMTTAAGGAERKGGWVLLKSKAELAEEAAAAAELQALADDRSSYRSGERD